VRPSVDISRRVDTGLERESVVRSKPVQRCYSSIDRGKTEDVPLPPRPHSSPRPNMRPKRAGFQRTVDSNAATLAAASLVFSVTEGRSEAALPPRQSSKLSGQGKLQREKIPAEARPDQSNTGLDTMMLVRKCSTS